MEVIFIPIVISLVYGIIELLKLTFKSEKFLNFVPLISAITGVVLCVIALYATPEFIPTKNLLEAIFLGLSSGLSATGSNQIIKQMLKINKSSTPSEIIEIISGDETENDSEINNNSEKTE